MLGVKALRPVLSPTGDARLRGVGIEGAGRPQRGVDLVPLRLSNYFYRSFSGPSLT